tara:strand:- start:710 stop:904 length:195 start_codon:yes stop_codon:yes gene_type:complete
LLCWRTPSAKQSSVSELGLVIFIMNSGRFVIFILLASALRFFIFIFQSAFFIGLYIYSYPRANY